jgi:hypothetical protein
VEQFDVLVPAMRKVELFRVVIANRFKSASLRAKEPQSFAVAGTDCAGAHFDVGATRMENFMKRILLAAAAVAVLGTSQALAQAVVIAPEQRTVIRDYVVKEKVRPHKLQSRVTIGATLPADVELAPVPEIWGPAFRSYRYVYTGDDVVLVDPSSRRVVHVID